MVFFNSPKQFAFYLVAMAVFFLASCLQPNDIITKAQTDFVAETSTSRIVDERPNILLIVADDLGYTDIGEFGGEIDTPNIDMLAATGISFASFHTAPVCAVTRAMLLSGNDNHIAGMGSQDLESQAFGYEGHLTDRIVPLPALLQKAGYHTSMIGKWHLGIAPEHLPASKGFEQSFIIPEGVANHYSEKGWLARDPVSTYLENNKPVKWTEGDYSTDVYTSKLIEYIDNNKDTGKPFFAFAAYTSPHWPLQVDEAYWKKYEGKYSEGYEALRQKRFENSKQLRLIPASSQLPEKHDSVKPWSRLSQDEKLIEARKMELYAGMVDNLDVNIGRILDYLKQTNQFENTIVVFMSDNGAAANDFYYHPYFADFLNANYTDAYAEMGKKDSFISYGPQWAEASSAPFRYFKGYTTQGGITSPMIISGANVKHSGGVTKVFSTLLDIAPTFYEYANVDYPKTFLGKDVYPLKGASMAALLANKTPFIHDNNYVFAFEHRQNIVVRKGDWKLVNEIKPFDPKNFALYNISEDISEQDDVKSEFPEVYQDLLAHWREYQIESQVQFPTPLGISR
jgi:arylsulfatase A-like enzyme